VPQAPGREFAFAIKASRQAARNDMIRVTPEEGNDVNVPADLIASSD
jgi:hypothetical protein